MNTLRAIAFWAVMIVPVGILIGFFPWLLIPYFVAGAVAAMMYAIDFGEEKEWGGFVSAFFLPHIYFLIKFIFSDGRVI